MRALFVGRLEVLAGLAAAFEDVGHDVAFACAPSSITAVEMAGFEALPAGLDVEAEPDHATAALAGDLAPLADRWVAHVVVHDDSGMHDGAALGAERAGLPTAVVHGEPIAPRQPSRARLHLAALPPSFQWTARPARWVDGEFSYLRPGPFPARPPDEDVAVGPAEWTFVMGALAAGTPVVLTTDTDLGFRVTAAGAGVLDGPDAAQQLLDEPLYFANAQRLRREIEAMPEAAAHTRAIVAITGAA